LLEAGKAGLAGVAARGLSLGLGCGTHDPSVVPTLRAASPELSENFIPASTWRGGDAPVTEDPATLGGQSPARQEELAGVCSLPRCPRNCLVPTAQRRCDSPCSVCSGFKER